MTYVCVQLRGEIASNHLQFSSKKVFNGVCHQLKINKIASTPVPPNESKTVKTDADLMWLKAYKADTSDIYFGEDFNDVKNASKNSPEYKGNQKNNERISN